jgi:hypothetical protein
MAAIAKPIFQDEFISKQSRWQIHLVWGLLATLAGAIGVIAYLVVARPIHMGILVTDQHGNPVGAIQPVTATGDVPAACAWLLYVALHSWSWQPLVLAAVLHWPVNWIMRAAGRHDPNYTTVYFNALKRPLHRPPHGRYRDGTR